MRSILTMHIAFENTTRLEKLALKYEAKIIWVPKFHCELNPIEGVWCEQKSFVRKHNEQDWNKFHNLLTQSREYYQNKKVNIKLWNRFWSSLDMYYKGSTYQEVLIKHFGAKSIDDKVKVKTRRKVKYFTS